MAPKHAFLLPPFVMLGLAAALGGSTLGAILLLRIQLSLGPVDPLWKQLHGQAQVFGFIVPLVLGFATFLVPRITAGRPIRRAFAMPALVALALAALAICAVPFASGMGAIALRRAVAGLISAGTLAGAICLQGSLPRQREQRGHERLLQASLAFLVLAGLADAAAFWLSAGAAEGDLPAGLASAAWRFAVEGFAVGMVLAVSVRMFSGFLGIETPLAVGRANRPTAARERAFTVAAWTWAASVALAGGGALFGQPVLERIGEVLFAAGMVPISLRLGLAGTAGGPAVDRTRDRVFPFGARAAYALLVTGASVGAAAAVADLAGLRVHSLWLDARRHLITIGFLLTLIATMAGRLAPGFAKRPLALPWLRVFALIAFVLSAALRSLEGVAGQWGPEWLLWLSALSGPLAAAGLFALALCLGATLLGAKPIR